MFNANYVFSSTNLIGFNPIHRTFGAGKVITVNSEERIATIKFDTNNTSGIFEIKDIIGPSKYFSYTITDYIANISNLMSDLFKKIQQQKYDEAREFFKEKCTNWWNDKNIEDLIFEHKQNIKKQIIEKQLRLQREKEDLIEDSKKMEQKRLARQELQAKLEIEEQERVARQRQFELEQQKQEAARRDFSEKINNAFIHDFIQSKKYYETNFSEYFNLSDYICEKLNFVKKWLNKNTPLSKLTTVKTLPDDEQTTAIATVNGHIQVVARAGSGKTTTLVNRTYFLLKHCAVAPNEMLLLAFNRSAALEIRRKLIGLLNEKAESAVVAEIENQIYQVKTKKRVKNDDILATAIDLVAANFNIELPHVMTFHALAYAIVHPEESILYNGPQGESQGLSRAFQQVIDAHLQIPAFKDQIRKLMLTHFQEDWERIIKGHYDQSQDELLRYRRSLLQESLNGDYVKSYGEKLIADFLFEHDITYKYERNHFWNDVNYRPDFTIFKTPKSGIIIEYFGLKGDQDYDLMTDKKIEYWNNKNNWELLAFYPYDVSTNGTEHFLEVLKKSLENMGVVCNKLSEDEIWHRIRDRAIDRFTTAAVGFVGRCRKQSLQPADLSKLVSGFATFSPVESMFLGLVQRLYEAYLERLAATGEEDFDGLMQRAAHAIDAGQTLFHRKAGTGDLAVLRYLCIDEFQDFSDLFYRLLTAIRKQNPAVELFSVGDDWQAINGFAGSDLRFFENFSEYIGDSQRLYISTNYRSAKGVVAVGNALMQGLGKPAIAHKATLGEVRLADLNTFKPTLLEKQRHSGDILTPSVLRLVSQGLANGHDVVMLCRRNSIPWYVSYKDQAGGNGRGLDRYLDLIRSYFPKELKDRITISTAHKYKGLEKPMVIVLDAVARSYPLIHPDWIFSRILGDSPEKIMKEERRLLYVALTRAVTKLVVITDGREKSPFIEELERSQPFQMINWADYPPIRGQTTRLVVKVGGQERRGSAPTFAIKDLLKASGYQFQGKSTGWAGWSKSFPAATFTVETIMSEIWADEADGIEVGVFDDTDQRVATFMVDAGSWTCVVDYLNTINTPPNEPASIDDRQL